MVARVTPHAKAAAGLFERSQDVGGACLVADRTVMRGFIGKYNEPFFLCRNSCRETDEKREYQNQQGRRPSACGGRPASCFHDKARYHGCPPSQMPDTGAAAATMTRQTNP